MVAELPTVHTTVDSMRAVVSDHRSAGRTVGLVPTLGALHAGHMSLVEAARTDNDVVVVSIFVNPLQFAPTEDLAAYPRTLQADLELLSTQAVEYVFHPDAATFTSQDAATAVHVDGLTAGLEGATRPMHFDGVATIVAKLFNSVGPDRAYFGAKDFQQQAIIHRMVTDLNMPLQVITCPLVRDSDGLALSSRNVFLSPLERQDALAISRCLQELSDNWEGNADVGRSLLVGKLINAQGVTLDYAEVIDPVTLEPLEGIHNGTAQAVVAAYVGTTRLIDTVSLTGPAAQHSTAKKR